MAAAGTVFIVDDDLPNQESLVVLLQAHGLCCTGYSSVAAFLRAYDPRQAGCLVAELAMPCQSGLDLLEEIDRHGWSIPTILVAGFVPSNQFSLVARHNVIAVLEKPYEQDDLLQAIDAAMKADQQHRTDAWRIVELHRLFARLPEAESRLLAKLAAGKRDAEISGEFDWAPETLDAHRRRILSRFGVQDVASLLAIVVEFDQLLSRNPRAIALAEILEPSGSKGPPGNVPGQPVANRPAAIADRQGGIDEPHSADGGSSLPVSLHGPECRG